MANNLWSQATTTIDLRSSSLGRLRRYQFQDALWQGVPKIAFFVADLSVGVSLGISAVLMHDWLSPLLPRGPFAVIGEMSIIMTMQMLLCFALGAIVGSMEVMIPGNLVGLLAMVLVLPMPMGANGIFVAGVFGALVLDRLQFHLRYRESNVVAHSEHGRDGKPEHTYPAY